MAQHKLEAKKANEEERAATKRKRWKLNGSISFVWRMHRCQMEFDILFVHEKVLRWFFFPSLLGKLSPIAIAIAIVAPRIAPFLFVSSWQIRNTRTWDRRQSFPVAVFVI